PIASPLSLHDALPISRLRKGSASRSAAGELSIARFRASRGSLSTRACGPIDQAQPGAPRRSEQAQPGRGQCADQETSLVTEPRLETQTGIRKECLDLHDLPRGATTAW